MRRPAAPPPAPSSSERLQSFNVSGAVNTSAHHAPSKALMHLQQDDSLSESANQLWRKSSLLHAYPGRRTSPPMCATVHIRSSPRCFDVSASSPYANLSLGLSHFHTTVAHFTDRDEERHASRTSYVAAMSGEMQVILVPTAASIQPFPTLESRHPRAAVFTRRRGLLLRAAVRLPLASQRWPLILVPFPAHNRGCGVFPNVYSRPLAFEAYFNGITESLNVRSSRDNRPAIDARIVGFLG